ncbi:Hypothetical_protein [Hexamita inflata]|uniref:Hypothetical_protein n=1 Tax=Hexamita inflata TaxID=28002 RepID=A0AA86RSI3_9EUKA|nr:Hypothetical protein HINF_LOCUS66517 [Hexamita inflata]CAI9978873.1 Hypothetical protein HINF_LOCUS66518 [Hexamita inflata]
MLFGRIVPKQYQEQLCCELEDVIGIYVQDLVDQQDSKQLKIDRKVVLQTQTQQPNLTRDTSINYKSGKEVLNTLCVLKHASQSAQLEKKYSQSNVKIAKE